MARLRTNPVATRNRTGAKYAKPSSVFPKKEADPDADRMLTRWLFTLISAVFFCVGMLAAVTEYAPPVSTRYGMTGALHGDMAVHFGVTVALFALMPLGMWARTDRAAKYWIAVTTTSAATHLIWALIVG